ncbi:MAG: hypothetical protein AAF702_45740 [Chloroflexota bacterium]
MKQEKYVMVTTQWRGVFAGFLVREDEDKRIVELREIRCAIDWETKGGFLELTDVGPNEKSIIGNRALAAKLQGITGIFECSDKAKEAWQSHENKS